MALHVARSGLVTTREGQRVRVYPGNIVEDGHWLLDIAPESFKPLEVQFPAPKATPKATPKT